MQQPQPPQHDLSHPAAPLPAMTHTTAADKTKKAAEDILFMEHWLLLFNQQEDEDNEHSHISQEVLSS